ncbi:MAG: TIGR04222 domain-containing membrane protein, partial [Proteobacteria bacterium]|nr:TIGR04222 domain-containing membrane protein [Pseudomonadota bacterium]
MNLLDFWPVNMPAGPVFLVWFVGFFIAALIVGYVARNFIVQESGGAASARPHLREGNLPSGDDLALVAVLRDGQRGLRDWILATALAEGFVTTGAVDGQFLLASGASPSPILRRLAGELARRGGTFSASVLTAEVDSLAADEEPRLRQMLRDDGLVPSAETRRRRAVASAAPALVVMALGGLRLVRGVVLDRPVGFLVVEILFVGLVFLIIQKSVVNAPTRRGSRLLEWLVDATRSVRGELGQSPVGSASDVSLTTALSGLAAVTGLAMFAPYRAMLPTPS